VGRRTWRISAYIEAALGERVYALARDRGGSVTGILEAALLEYLAARPNGATFPLAARLPNPPGRPSELARAAGAAREERVRKRTGRPLGRITRHPAASARERCDEHGAEESGAA
jgi:hypothetical protein